MYILYAPSELSHLTTTELESYIMGLNVLAGTQYTSKDVDILYNRSVVTSVSLIGCSHGTFHCCPERSSEERRDPPGPGGRHGGQGRGTGTRNHQWQS